MVRFRCLRLFCHGNRPAIFPSSGSGRSAPFRIWNICTRLFDATSGRCSHWPYRRPFLAATYILGPFRLDAATDTLFRGGEPVSLGHRAVALLRVLVEQQGTPVSKDALMEAAWAGLTVEESNLAVQIAVLRRVLGEEAGGENWIETPTVTGMAKRARAAPTCIEKACLRDRSEPGAAAAAIAVQLGPYQQEAGTTATYRRN